MIILHLSLGTEDYNRVFLARVTLFDLTLALGHGYYHWFQIEGCCDWGLCKDRYARAIAKDVPGEGFIEMLLRHCAPGWRR